MAVVEHRPPVYPEIPEGEPGFFPNGPIQGAPDWQQRTLEIVTSLWVGTDTLHFTNPRRELPIGTGEFTEEDYFEQVTWEHDHRMRSAKFGGHMFWFAAQDDSIPYPDGREYAKTTKKELIHSLGMLDSGDPLNIAIGYDPDYRGADRWLNLHLRRLSLTVHTTLEATAQDLIKQIEANYG